MPLPEMTFAIERYRLTVNAALGIACLLAYLVSLAWYGQDGGKSIDGRHRTFGIMGLLCDVALPVFAQLGMQNGFIRVTNGQDAVIFSAWATLLYACLEVPHIQIHIVGLVFHLLYKFVVLLVVCCSLDYFRTI